MPPQFAGPFRRPIWRRPSRLPALDRDVARVLARPRLQAILVTVFAVIAVGLAILGLYRLLAYVVSQRHREIGIRLALGATRRTIFGELFREGAGLVVCGLAIGLASPSFFEDCWQRSSSASRLAIR